MEKISKLLYGILFSMLLVTSANADESLKNPAQSQVLETNTTTYIQQEPAVVKECSLDVSKVTSLLIPISLIVLFLVLLVNGVRELVKFFYNSQDERLYKSWLKILTLAYISFGFLIFFAPPQYFSQDYQYQIYGKFSWVWKTHKIDYLLMGFEVFGYLLLGTILYIFLNKIYKKA